MPSRRPLLAAAALLVAVSLGVAQAPKAGGPPAKSSDVELVERLLGARKEYQATLEALRAHYIAQNDLDRARWAEEELIQFHRIPKQAFRLDLDVPPPKLEAAHNYPEANELYRQAMTYKDKGWGSDYVDNQRRAELLFQKLLSNYPQSDKISDAAYQLGDIYESRAYKQNARAAAYFERSFQWNPKTQFDARMRAARLYERSLNERKHAMEIYQEVISHETDDKRVEEARKRLADLSQRK
jgi:TolA-binding protein